MFWTIVGALIFVSFLPAIIYLAFYILFIIGIAIAEAVKGLKK